MPNVKTLVIRLEAFRDLRNYQVRHRSDWHAVFSTNQFAELWPFARWGNTPLPERVELPDAPDILRAITSEYLSVSPKGGRFFINRAGAFFKLDIFGSALIQQFLAFEIRN